MSNGNGEAPKAASPPRINISSLTLDELVLLEEKVGHKVVRELGTFDFSADTVRALVWIAMLRDNPDAMLADAGKLNFDELNRAIEAPDDVPPPTPASDSSGRSGTTPAGTSSTSARRKPAAAPSSASSTG